MAKTFFAINKECATCEYWDGPRRINSDPRTVQCPDGQVPGTCCSPNSNFRGRQMKSSTGGGVSVTCYRRWRYLKD